VGIAHQWIGIIFADQGEREAALKSFSASTAAFDGLLRDDPQDDTAQTQLVTNCSKMGEIHLAAGRLEHAAESFDRTRVLVEALAQRRPDRPDILRLLGVEYYKLAELERTRAQDEAAARPVRVERWQVARAWLVKCRDVFVDMQRRNVLAPADVKVPDELSMEIAGCDAEIGRLGTAASQTAPAGP
jgi:hypothetical protein